MIILICAQSEASEEGVDAAVVLLKEVVESLGVPLDELLALTLTEGRADQKIGSVLSRAEICHYRFEGGTRNRTRHVAAVANSSLVLLIGEGRGIKLVRAEANRRGIEVLEVEG